MKTCTLVKIAEVTGGRIIQGDPQAVLRSVSTDTRKIRSGDLFFALTGENYDAHSFLNQAGQAGAGGLVISHMVDIPPDIPAILVDNTLAALQALAAFNRVSCGVAVVGITGSTGKTTTKDMVASVLGTRFKTLKTTGNLNNEIGLPLTLLELDETFEAAVVEMGMRGPGEIDALCRLARPDAAVISNIGETHLELLGSVSNIAAAKGEILEHIPPGGFALLNAESPFITREAARCRGKVIFFGINQPGDITAENIRPERGGNRFTAIFESLRAEFFLPVPGRHNVMNSLAAIGVGLKLGLSEKEIAKGLTSVTLTGMRLETIDTGSHRIINDAYNASPASSKAALQVLKETAGARRKVAVLGNMLELGERAQAGHREVGETAAVLAIDYLVTVGDLAVNIAEGAAQKGMSANRILRCNDNQEAIGVLVKLLQPGDVVLVKGSRGMKMEQIVKSLI